MATKRSFDPYEDEINDGYIPSPPSSSNYNSNTHHHDSTNHHHSNTSTSKPHKRARHHDEHASSSSTKASRSSKKHNDESQTDLTYGQRACFPGLDGTGIHGDGDIEFEDAGDAMAYLRAVRQEASAIPHVVRARGIGPQQQQQHSPDGEERVDRDIYDSGRGDARGWYADGAYTAAPDDEDYDDDDGGRFEQRDATSRYDGANNTSTQLDYDGVAERDEEDARLGAAYFESISVHFLALRARLHQTPPPDLVAALSPESSPHVGRFGPKSTTFAVWSARIQKYEPHPVQIAAMDRMAVLRVLRVMVDGTLLKQGRVLEERTSRWVWSLLARLPDRGELDHVEVAGVREVGKRAALLMHHLQEAAAAGVAEGQNLGEMQQDEEEDDYHRVPCVGEAENPDASAQTLSARNLSHSPSRRVVNSSSPAPSDTDSVNMEVDHHEADAEEGGNPATELGTNETNETNESPNGDLTQADLDLEAAKQRLFAQLENDEDDDLDADGSAPSEAGVNVVGKDDTAESLERMNTRMTLNMILTVAGEFYGQRDLLEFRVPFGV